MKKILIIVVCAGMSIGLLIGGVSSIESSGFDKATAAQNPGAALACTITPCSLDEVIQTRVFSPSLNGYESHKIAQLQAEINDLKAEFTEEAIARIYHALGKISVLLGGLNSTIDIKTETLQKMSLDKQTDYEFTGILYIADTE